MVYNNCTEPSAASFGVSRASTVSARVCLKAGIATSANADQLLIALEPEAASIHIRRLRMRQLVPDKPVRRPLSVRLDHDVDAAAGGGHDAQQVAAKFTQRKSRNSVSCYGRSVEQGRPLYWFTAK